MNIILLMSMLVLFIYLFNKLLRRRSHFGDGSDGNLIIHGESALIRDINCENIIIIPGAILFTMGFKVNVRGCLRNSGTIYGW
jgi:hypothetical protein